MIVKTAATKKRKIDRMASKRCRAVPRVTKRGSYHVVCDFGNGRHLLFLVRRSLQSFFDRRFLCALRDAAVSPISVFMPVLLTIAAARPLVITENTMLSCNYPSGYAISDPEGDSHADWDTKIIALQTRRINTDRIEAPESPTRTFSVAS